MSEATSKKPTAASVHEDFLDLKAVVEAQEKFIAEMCGVVNDLRAQVVAIEVTNVQLKTELMELRNTTKAVAKPAAKVNELKQDEDGVYTFVPATANVTAVSTLTREAIKLDGEIVRCTSAVWAFWRTTLERRAKASAREQSQYEEYCA
jgi:hypothetical protein